jgi:RNA polymerase sigma-70 factor (ECF subfamily)
MTQTEIIELVKEIQKGNKIAETKLYKGLHSFVYLICYNYIKNKEDAEDLTNESFVKIFKSIDTYETKCTFLTWVGTITKNNCLNFVRSKSYKNLQLNYNVDKLLFETPSLLKNDDFDKNVNERFGDYDIQLCINKLNPLEKQLIDLVYFQGYKVKELNNIFTDLDSVNIRVILFRAKKKIKNNLLQLEKKKNNNQILFS